MKEFDFFLGAEFAIQDPHFIVLAMWRAHRVIFHLNL